MTENDAKGRIETVLGEIGDERAAEILDFWSEHGALPGEEGRKRLPEVVCLLRDDRGGIAGVCSAFEADLGVVGGRSFWLYRSFLLPGALGAQEALIKTAFEALEAEFDPAGNGPIGLCLLATGQEEMAQRREVVWPETQLMLAGYLDDGRQARIRYFEDARIGPGLPDSPTLGETRSAEYTLEDRYRIVPLTVTATEAEGVTNEDVIAFWEREGAVTGEEANRRVHEVHLVAVARDEGVVGISSAYLQRNSQLRLDLWYYRAFVGREHRMSSLAVLLAVRGREHLQDRFTSGEDTRGAGIAYEVENDGLKRYFNRALWMPTDFTFIGENQRGDHVRVHYFPGARIPEPA